MKTYSDLQGIDPRLAVVIELESVGNPDVGIIVGDTYGGGILYKSIRYECTIDLLKPFVIQIILRNKIYSMEKETAVIVKKLQIDSIDIIPGFEYFASYCNDHNDVRPTNYLGFNGQWTLTFDRPFYQWLHQAKGQGWLLS